MTKATQAPALPKIDKGIPIPKNSAGRPGTLIAVLEALEIGDSFVWRHRHLDRSARSCGIKIVTRAQPDGTFRIWRVS